MAENPNPTTNHDFPQPDKGDLDGTWGETVNEELTQRLEERLVARDTEANLSNYTPYDEAIFIATDTGAVYDGDGTSWNKADRDFETVAAADIEATDTLTDPSGTAHTGELADSSDLHSRYTDEEAEDAVAAILGGGDKISILYDDPNDNLTVDTSALDTEEVEDAVSSLVTSDSNLSWTYDDQNDTLTISLADSISVGSLEADRADITNVGTKVTKSTKQTVSASTLTKVTWDAVQFDDLGEFDSQNDKWVAQRDGRYLVSARVEFKSLSDQTFYQTLVYLNGSIEFRSGATRSGGTEQEGKTALGVLDLTQGDELEVYVDHTDSSSRVTNDYQPANRFAVSKIA